MKVQFVWYPWQFWILPILIFSVGSAVRYPFKYAFAFGWGTWAMIIRWGNRE